MSSMTSIVVVFLAEAGLAVKFFILEGSTIDLVSELTNREQRKTALPLDGPEDL